MERITAIIGRYVTPKNVARIVTAVYLLSLIPVLVIGVYNYPSADDYNIGNTCRQAWVATHSVWQVLKQAAEMAVDDWFNWMGYFTSIFLMAVHPGVFGEKAYSLTVWIMAGSLSLSTAYLLHNIFVKVFKADKYMSRIVTMLMLFVTVHCMVGRTEALYWYCGAVNYTFLHSLSLFYYGLLIAAVYDEGKKRKLELALASVLGFMTGGGNQMTALNVAVVLVVAVGFMAYRKLLGKYKAFWIPMGCFFLGFILNVAAPGNWVRASGTGGMGAVKSVFVSLYYCLDYAMGQWSSWPLFLLVLALIPLFWHMAGETDFRFDFPAIAVFFGYCLVSAMITPPLFAVGNIEAGRLQALVYMMYVLVLTLCVGYVTGWVRKRLVTEKADTGLRETKSGFTVYTSCWLISCALFFLMASGLTLLAEPHYYTFSSAVTDLCNGNARAYGDALARRTELYNSDVQGIIEVEPLPVQPALLYFSDIKPEADSWENAGLARYYQKEGVVLKTADLQ